MPPEPKQTEILQGTLNMMILQVLQQGAANGYEIARFIEQRSEELLQVEHGSLYPALRRLETKGLIRADLARLADKPPCPLLFAYPGR